MPEKSDHKVAPSMVREADLLAVKAQLKDLKNTLASKDAELAQLKSEVKVTKANLTDGEEEKDVRSFLLDRSKELDEREAEITKKLSDLQERESSYTEREKEERIKSLASEYGVKIEDIKDAEDPEKQALKINRETLIKEKGTSPAEQVFESTPAGGKIKKSVKDMDDKEFAQFEKDLKAKAGIPVALSK